METHTHVGDILSALIPAGRSPVDADSSVLVFVSQTHHTIMTQLLQSSVRLLDCPWLQQQHRIQVETCIKTLAMTGDGLTHTHTHTPIPVVLMTTCFSSLQPRVVPSLFLWTWRLRSAPCCPPPPSTPCPAPTQTTGPRPAHPGPLFPATPGTTRTSSRNCRWARTRAEVRTQPKNTKTPMGT